MISEWLKHIDNETLRYLIIVVVTFGIAGILSSIIRRLLNRFFRNAAEILRLDHTRFNFFKNAISFIIFLTATIVVIYAIPKFRTLGVTLFASAGIFTAIMAFAAQQAFSNIVSGIFIVIFKPFRVDDMVTIGTDTGYIEDITLRHTVIRNFENRRIIIPNSAISNQTIVNSNIGDERICNFIFMDVSFDSDVEKAMKIMEEVAMQHENFIDTRTPEDKQAGNRAVVVRVLGYKDSAIQLRASVWSSNALKGFVMKCDLYLRYKNAFEENGIEIPYPHRSIVMKNQKKNHPRDFN